ncbi:unnamed protein product [Amoebophrya sp. A25]|nr:unnamed protein product [Amoebophrya sp. A25]|eukprot:GSA25T00026686001.1
MKQEDVQKKALFLQSHEGKRQAAVATEAFWCSANWLDLEAHYSRTTYQICCSQCGTLVATAKKRFLRGKVAPPALFINMDVPAGTTVRSRATNNTKTKQQQQPALVKKAGEKNVGGRKVVVEKRTTITVSRNNGTQTHLFCQPVTEEVDPGVFQWRNVVNHDWCFCGRWNKGKLYDGAGHGAKLQEEPYWWSCAFKFAEYYARHLTKKCKCPLRPALRPLSRRYKAMAKILNSSMSASSLDIDGGSEDGATAA